MQSMWLQRRQRRKASEGKTSTRCKVCSFQVGDHDGGGGVIRGGPAAKCMVGGALGLSLGRNLWLGAVQSTKGRSIVDDQQILAAIDVEWSRRSPTMYSNN